MRALERRPTLRPELRPFWDAFMDLCAARGAGMGGALPISMEAIRALLEMREVPRRSWPLWLDLLRALDVTWLAFQREKAENKED